MKKVLLLPMLLFVTTASAQLNLQLHYDFGRYTNESGEKDRQLFTSTVEYFNADKLGCTYFFVDMDYLGRKLNDKGEYETNHGNISAYWEIGRDFTFAKVKNTNTSFTAHIEYDGGINCAGPFQQALLAGPAWQWHSNDFNKIFTLQLLYKQYLKGNNGLDAFASFQVTPVWSITFARGLCTFSGFFDLWWGNTPKNTYNGNPNKKSLVFLTEPQFWFNLVGRNRQNQKFSVGTEFECSNNFIWYTNNKNNTFYWNPTIAVKYVF